MAPTAVDFKEQGNALFVKKKYQDASVKYTKAIALDDGTLASILYGNRAACWLGLGRYIHAAMDATKAAELNPSYTKAHTRLASARDSLGQPWHSIIAWQNAIDTLPTENLTEAEEKAKAEMEESLLNASHDLDKLHPNNIPVEWRSTFKFPPTGHCALAMLPELKEQGASKKDSCAWYVAEAYLHFEKAKEVVRGYQTRPEGMVVVPKATFHFSELVLRLAMIFTIRTDDKWFFELERQIEDESKFYRGWGEATVEKVISEAPGRVATEGWDQMRPVFDNTVRYLVCRGYLIGQHVNGMKFDQEVDYLTRAVKIIEWGRKVWENVETDKRGNIFDEGYLHGTRKLLLDGLFKLKVSEEDPSNLPKILDTMKSEAYKILHHPMDLSNIGAMMEEDPSGTIAFVVAPRATAQMVMGVNFYGDAGDSDDPDEVAKLHCQAAAIMVESTEHYPNDDINVALCLGLAFPELWAAPSPVDIHLKLLERFKDSYTKVLPIWWEVNVARTIGDQVKTMAKTALPALENLKKKIKDGEIAMDDLTRESTLQVVPKPHSQSTIESVECLRRLH